MKKQIPFNTDKDGNSRCIKAGYYKTGGVRMEKLLKSGKVDRPYLWIDTYNQCVSDVAGTITVGVDFRNEYYVSVLE